MVKAQQVVKGKLVKKSWHPIISTTAFNSAPLGETYVAEPSAMTGMHLTVNLANLTGDIRQQGISLKFKIIEVDNGSGIATVVGYEASSSQLRRLVRRGVERFDDSVDCKTSDSKLIKVKPYAVTRASTSKAKISLVRLKLREEITNEVAKQTFDELVKNVISHKLQSSLKGGVKKILPLRALEIRRLQIVSEPKPKVSESGTNQDKKKEKAEAKKEEIQENKADEGEVAEEKTEEVKEDVKKDQTVAEPKTEEVKEEVKKQ